MSWFRLKKTSKNFGVLFIMLLLPQGIKYGQMQKCCHNLLKQVRYSFSDWVLLH